MTRHPHAVVAGLLLLAACALWVEFFLVPPTSFEAELLEVGPQRSYTSKTGTFYYRLLRARRLPKRNRVHPACP